jgi:hypothetical protein
MDFGAHLGPPGGAFGALFGHFFRVFLLLFSNPQNSRKRGENGVRRAPKYLQNGVEMESF